MRYIVFSFGLLIIALPTFAQSVGTDSISSTKTLDEVMVTASNINRVGNLLLSFPIVNSENMRSMDSEYWRICIFQDSLLT